MSNILTDAVQRYITNTPSKDYKATGIGELAPLGQSPFDYSTHRYPLEGLGDADAPHYMLFNINVPTGSKYLKDNPNSVVENTPSASTADFNFRQQNGLATNSPAAGHIGATAALNGYGVVAKDGFNVLPTDVTWAVIKGGAGAKIVQDTLRIKPQLKRITTSIALYLPDAQLTAQYEHSWGAIDLTTALGLVGVASAAQGELDHVFSTDVIDTGENLVDAGKQFFNGSLFNSGALAGGPGAELAAYGAKLSGVTGDGIAPLIMRSQNRAVNPQVQMVFSGTMNRDFIFDFDFQPRSQQEAIEIYKIIKTFKKFAAPEIAKGFSGRYFIPPAQFDIKFFFKAQENPVIAKISTCALTSITVDYNKSPPFASFTDGMPAHINMQLRFKEMDIITRELIDQFGY